MLDLLPYVQNNLLERASDEEYMAAVEAGDMAKAQRMVDEAVGISNDNPVFYRAGSSVESGVKPWSSWSREFETAERYTEEGVGHGGPRLRAVHARIENTLDLTEGISGMRIAKAIGLSGDDAAVFAENADSIGSRYPWEESKRIRAAITDAGFDSVRYLDDYPDGAETTVLVSPTAVVETQVPITRDDSGRVIPLSQRFNQSSNDVRY